MAEVAEDRGMVENSEKINQFRNMEGAYMWVVVHSAVIDDEKYRDPPACSVQLSTEGQKMQTQESWETYMPMWNESFTFNIVRGDDPLFIKICTINALYQVKSIAT